MDNIKDKVEQHWIRLMEGDLTPDQRVSLRQQLQNLPGGEDALTELDHLMRILAQMPDGDEVPWSELSDEAIRQLPPMPPELKQKVRTIPTRSALQNPLSGLLARILIPVFVAAMALVFLFPNTREVTKGDGPISKDVDTRVLSVSLSLISRVSEEEKMYLMPLEELAPNRIGIRVERNQVIQPVLRSLELDLSETSWFLTAFTVDSGGEVHFLSHKSEALSLNELPDSAHLYAPPNPLALSVKQEMVGKLARLHIILTKSQLAPSQIEMAETNRSPLEALTPQSFLKNTDRALPLVHTSVLLRVK